MRQIKNILKSKQTICSNETFKKQRIFIKIKRRKEEDEEVNLKEINQKLNFKQMEMKKKILRKKKCEKLNSQAKNL